MRLSEELSKLKELESRITKKVEDVKLALGEEIQTSPIDGVTTICDRPHCFTVSSSTVFSTPGSILDPRYYSPKSQAEAVMSKLNNCQRIEKVGPIVAEMIRTKKVKIGSDYVPLNEKTLSILKDSGLAEV